MSRNLLGVAAVALALVAGASGAEAQRPVSIGLSAGVSLPVGVLGDGAETGYNVSAMADLGLPTLPFGFRIEGMYNALGLTSAEGESYRVLALTGNLKWALPGVAMRPYVIVGGGLYNSKFADAEGDNNFGMNGGVGLDFALSGFTTFGEIRFHSSFIEEENWNFIPVTFGIRF